MNSIKNDLHHLLPYSYITYMVADPFCDLRGGKALVGLLPSAFAGCGAARGVLRILRGQRRLHESEPLEAGGVRALRAARGLRLLGGVLL